MEPSFKARTNNICQTETDLCKNFYIDALVSKGSLDLDGVNSNVSETLAIFERALEQHGTILGTNYLNNVLK